MCGAPLGARRVVVRGRPDQRMPEREVVATEGDHPRLLGSLQVSHREPADGKGVEDAQQIAVSVGGRDDERRPGRRRQPLEHQVDDALPARPDRHRVGQVGPALALVGIEQVGGLDERRAGCHRWRR